MYIEKTMCFWNIEACKSILVDPKSKGNPSIYSPLMIKSFPGKYMVKYSLLLVSR